MTAASAPGTPPVEATRLVLELRGPMPAAALLEALAALDVDLGPDELDGVLARAGAVTVAGPGGTTLIALARRRPSRPERAALDDDPRLVALLRSAPPALLVALVVAVLLVAAVLLAGLNAGARSGPTLEYRPPPTTRG